MRSIRRDSKTKGPGQVAPLTYNLVDRICSQSEADTRNPLAGLRDSAIIRLMSDCLLRVSEVAAVNCGDLKENTLTIRQRKTDQLGEGRVLFVGDETVQVIEELKAKTDISRGALFRRVLKNGKMTTTRLTPEAIREIVKKRSQGIRGVKGRVSGHSLRVGSAVSLARGNASLVEIASGRSMEGFTDAVPLCERRNRSKECDGSDKVWQTEVTEKKYPINSVIGHL